MNRESLNKKAWYRAVKVVFVIFFLVSQGFVFIMVNVKATEQVLIVHCLNGGLPENTEDYVSHATPEYGYVGIYEINSICDEYNASKIKIDRRQYETNYWLESRDKYSLIQQIGLYLLSFLVVGILWWVAVKIFFYIVIGERFFPTQKTS